MPSITSLKGVWLHWTPIDGNATEVSTWAPQAYCQLSAYRQEQSTCKLKGAGQLTEISGYSPCICFSSCVLVSTLAFAANICGFWSRGRSKRRPDGEGDGSTWGWHHQPQQSSFLSAPILSRRFDFCCLNMWLGWDSFFLFEELQFWVGPKSRREKEKLMVAFS